MKHIKNCILDFLCCNLTTLILDCCCRSLSVEKGWKLSIVFPLPNVNIRLIKAFWRFQGKKSCCQLRSTLVIPPWPITLCGYCLKFSSHWKLTWLPMQVHYAAFTICTNVPNIAKLVFCIARSKTPKLFSFPLFFLPLYWLWWLG